MNSAENNFYAKTKARICAGLLASYNKFSLRLCEKDFGAMKLSFSLHGEDLLIFNHLKTIPPDKRGIYVDAGCYDPYIYSNTRLMSLYGWRGVNIDAASDVIDRFKKHRPMDHNVCCALGDTANTTLVGPVGSSMRKVVPADGTLGGQSERVHHASFQQIFATAPFAITAIDLLDIDCEGQDLIILRQFPFEVFRPRLITLEVSFLEKQQVDKELENIGYLRVGTRGCTQVYRCKESLPKLITKEMLLVE